MPGEDLESVFPRLAAEGYEITSPASQEYNCIAWAAYDTSKKWDPHQVSGRYWPEGVPRGLDLETFIRLFEIEGGYEPCETEDLESGFEKIAIYCNSFREVTHAARQKENGSWTSKLGDGEDIEHKTLTGLSGEIYGQVTKILRRARA